MDDNLSLKLHHNNVNLILHTDYCCINDWNLVSITVIICDQCNDMVASVLSLKKNHPISVNFSRDMDAVFTVLYKHFIIYLPISRNII